MASINHPPCVVQEVSPAKIRNIEIIKKKNNILKHYLSSKVNTVIEEFEFLRCIYESDLFFLQM